MREVHSFIQSFKSNFGLIEENFIPYIRYVVREKRTDRNILSLQRHPRNRGEYVSAIFDFLARYNDTKSIDHFLDYHFNHYPKKIEFISFIRKDAMNNQRRQNEAFDWKIVPVLPTSYQTKFVYMACLEWADKAEIALNKRIERAKIEQIKLQEKVEDLKNNRTEIYNKLELIHLETVELLKIRDHLSTELTKENLKVQVANSKLKKIKTEVEVQTAKILECRGKRDAMNKEIESLLKQKESNEQILEIELKEYSENIVKLAKEKLKMGRKLEFPIKVRGSLDNSSIEPSMIILLVYWFLDLRDESGKPIFCKNEETIACVLRLFEPFSVNNMAFRTLIDHMTSIEISLKRTRKKMIVNKTYAEFVIFMKPVAEFLLDKSNIVSNRPPKEE